MELFDNFFDYGGGLHFLTRYAHVLFGITWIGLLYFFNFVQVPAFAEMEAQARSEALRKITFRALWWFRWAAALTIASGLLMWAIAGGDYAPDTSLGLSITFGSILGHHDGRQRVDGHLAQPADQHQVCRGGRRRRRGRSGGGRRRQAGRPGEPGQRLLLDPDGCSSWSSRATSRRSSPTPAVPASLCGSSSSSSWSAPS